MVRNNKKIWLVVVGLCLSGCATNKEPEFKPLAPEKLHDLLHTVENYAYKSITKEDYIIKESCSNDG